MRRHAIYWSELMKPEQDDPLSGAKAVIVGAAVGAAMWLAIYLVFLL